MNTSRLLTKLKRKSSRYKHWILPAVTVSLTLILTYTLLTLLSVPRAPRLKSGSGDTLYSVSNRIYSAGIGTKDGTPQINFSRGNSGLSFTLAGSAKVKPIKNSSTVVTFPSVQSGIDLIYTTEVDGLKEEIILHETPKSNTFLFDLSLTNADSKTLTSDYLGSTFYDDENNYLFHFEKPFAFDASGNRTDNVSLQITEDKQLPGNYSMKLIVDAVWLNDPARAYPVIVDPTIVHDTTAEFAAGTLNRLKDTGSGSSPTLESYYQELVADQYTVGLWHLDEGSDNTCSGGQDACDKSGNGNHGTFSGNAAFTATSKIGGYATTFDGTGDYISAGDIAVLDTAKNLSACTWVYLNDVTNDQAFIGKSNAATDGWYIFRDETAASSGRTDIFTLFFADSASANNTRVETATGTAAIINTWNHLCFTFEAAKVGGLKVYYNGIPGDVADTTLVTAIDASANPFTLGARSDGTIGFNGIIDDTIISTRVFTQEEIKQLASRRSSAVYTSEVLDLGGANSFVTTWNSFSWTELGVTTGDGETLADTSGLVAQWNFNETSGTTADNAAGSCGASCDGTLTSFASTASQDQAAGTGWTADNKRWGAGAIMLDGTDDNVSAGTVADLKFTGDFSLEAWVKPTGSTVGQIVSNGTNSDWLYILGGSTVSSPICKIYQANSGSGYLQVDGKTPITDGKWHHVVCTLSGTTLSLYIDGMLEATSSTTTGSRDVSSAGTFTIGKFTNASSSYYAGFIDSFRAYSRPLTSGEIMSNYQAGNLEFQTRVGGTTDPNDGTWEAWRPTTGESLLDSYDTTLSEDLIGYWPMDESSGTRFDRWSTNNLTANGTGGVGTGTGKINGSADFETSESDYLEITDNTALSTGDIDYTFSTWVNLESEAADMEILTKYESAGANEYRLFYLQSSDVFRFVIYDGSGNVLGARNSSINPTTGTWYHIVVYHDATNNLAGMVVNNATAVTSSTTGGPIDSTANFRIGARNTTETAFFDGLIDEIGFWKRLLTSDEISYLYGSGSPKNNLLGTDPTNLSQFGGIRPSPETVVVQENSASTKYSTGRIEPDGSTVGLWHLDETGGTGAYLKDSTTNANHGTPTGTTLINGVNEKGRSFNGSSDTISISNESNFDFERTQAFSIQGWVKTTSSATQAIFSKIKDSSPFNGFSFFIETTGQLNVRLTNTSNTNTILVYGAGTVNDGKWHHVAMTYTGSSLSSGVAIYIDGVSQSITTTYNTLSATILNDLTPYIGSRNNINQFFSGSIDEVQVRNIANSAEEIAESYRLSRDHYANKTISSTDLSGKTSLPFYVAADRPGSYLQASLGESAFSNGQPDANTVGLWRMDDTPITRSIVYDNTSSTVCSTAGTTCTLTGMTINQGAGNNRIVVVGVGTELGGDVTNVTFNGVSGTEIAEEDVVDGNATASLWYFKDSELPSASGSYDVVATTTSLTNRIVGAISLSNVSQLGPESVAQTSNTATTTISTSITTYSYGSIVVDTLIDGQVADITATGDANHLERYEADASTTTGAGGTTTTTTAGSKTISYSATTANRLALIAAAFAPANSILDSSGNNLNGVPTSMTHTSGKTGMAGYFNGSNNSISLGNISSLNFERTDSFTIDAWINTSTATQGVIFSKRQPTSPYAGYELRRETNGSITFLLANTSTSNMLMAQTTTSVSSTGWHHVVATYDGSSSASGVAIYFNGVLQPTTNAYDSLSATTQTTSIAAIGSRSNTILFTGLIDEVRVSNTARSADDIRQTYEYGMGLRSHPITIDFGASLDAGNLIADSNDLSFTVDATVYGLSNKGSKLYPGEKIIIRENYDGTQYLAQGTVTAITESTGATTIASWDSGSTFPSGGYTASASVFKWQREYWNISGKTLDSHLDAITNISLRLTNGSEGRTIWLDDLRSNSDYLTNSAGSTITSSTGERYFQYRAILSSWDEAVTATLSGVTVDYDINVAPSTPTLDTPTDAATNQSLTPVLQTTTTDSDSDYLRYKIELCENVGMTTNCQTFDQTSSQTGWSGQNAQTSTAYTSGTQANYTLSSPLSPSSTYYWRSYAIDPAGTNTWSSTQGTPYSFTTTTAPTSPTTPWTEGATNPTGIIDTTPEFSAIHNDGDGDPAVFYEIEVNTASDFTGTVMWDTGSTSMTSLADGVRSSDVSYAGSALSWGTIYYWRIRFTDDLGALGAWSTTQSFTTNTPPTTPTLDSPTNTATNQSLTPTLQTTTTDADSDYLRYKIELCENVGMTTNCQTYDQTISQTGWSGQNAQTSTAYTSGTQASYTLQSALSPNTTYYWRSYGIDPAGTNTWGNTQGTPYSFTTTPLSPASRCLISENNTDTSLTISWVDHSLIEDNYEVQRSVNGGAFSVLATSLPANTTSYADTTYTQGNTYQYRIAPYLTSGPLYAPTWCITNTLTINSGNSSFEGVVLEGLIIN